MAGDIQCWKVHKQAIHIVFAAFQFIKRTEVHIIAQIPAWVFTYCDLMICAQLFYQLLQVQIGVYWVVQLKLMENFLFLALFATVVGNSEILVVISAVFQEIYFVGPDSKMNVENLFS
jgi:hypothetical protein